MDNSKEFLEAMLAGNAVLINTLIEQNTRLREMVTKLRSCIDVDRDWEESREALQLLKDTEI